MITMKYIYRTYCQHCKIYKNYRESCGPIYCLTCGDYKCADSKKNLHKCNPKRVKRHNAALKAANKRGQEARTTLPPYGEQLKDGFFFSNHDKCY